MDDLEHVAPDSGGGALPSAAQGRRRTTVGSLLALLGIVTVIAGAAVAGAGVADLVARSLVYFFVPWPLLLLGILDAMTTYGPPALLRLAIGVLLVFGGYALTLHAVDVVSGPLRRRSERADAGVDDGDLEAFARLTGAEPVDGLRSPPNGG